VTIKIDKDVPVPAANAHASKYPFHLMEIGDSFFVSDEDRNPDHMRSTAAIHGKRNQTRYRVRKVENGARVWRIE